MARVIGTSTSRARYSAATTTTPTVRVVSAVTPGSSAGATWFLRRDWAAMGCGMRSTLAGHSPVRMERKRGQFASYVLNCFCGGPHRPW